MRARGRSSHEQHKPSATGRKADIDADLGKELPKSDTHQRYRLSNLPSSLPVWSPSNSVGAEYT